MVRIKILLLILICILLFSGCGPNKSYIYPEGCEGVGVINNLPEGTDVTTQLIITAAGMENPEIREYLIQTFEQFNIVIETIQDSNQLYDLLNTMTEEVNSKYSVALLILKSNLIALMDDKIPLTKCDYDRLLYWSNSNIENLKNSNPQ